jgi:hypothetical protein
MTCGEYTYENFGGMGYKNVGVLVPKHILDYSKVAAAVEWKLTQVSELPSVMAGSDCCCIIALGTVRIVDFQTAHVFIFEITPLYLNRITVTFV